jgi:aldose 1-epimerase
VNLTPNDVHGNALHGGAGKGWGDQVWTLAAQEPLSVTYTYRSPAGDQGFPGTVDASVTYSLAPDTNTLTAVMEATSDAATPLNLAQHSYFNLNGQGNGTILSTVAQIEGDWYTELDWASGTLLPTGAIKPVAGTAFDFTQPAVIGSRFDSIPDPEPGYTGYDLLYVLFGRDGPAAKAATADCAVGPDPRFAAKFTAPESGRTLELWTNAPGLEIYTGNHLDGGVAGKGGLRYPQHAGFALEAQDFSDFMHHPHFPQCVLRPGGAYRRVWQLKFGTDAAVAA